MLILSILQKDTHHGYEIAKLIRQESGNRLNFQASSLYPVLFRMEKRGWIKGRWVEKEGVRRRRFYALTAKGEEALAHKREVWKEFTLAVNQVVDPSPA